jgi:hypothetical protein
MTFQSDPNRDPERSDRLRLRYNERDYGSWSIVPLALAVVIVLLVGLMLFGGGSDQATDSTKSTQATTPSAPNGVTPPARTPSDVPATPTAPSTTPSTPPAKTPQ